MMDKERGNVRCYCETNECSHSIALHVFTMCVEFKHIMHSLPGGTHNCFHNDCPLGANGSSLHPDLLLTIKMKMYSMNLTIRRILDVGTLDNPAVCGKKRGTNAKLAIRRV